MNECIKDIRKTMRQFGIDIMYRFCDTKSYIKIHICLFKWRYNVSLFHKDKVNNTTKFLILDNFDF